jgi:hypothetical protein
VMLLRQFTTAQLVVGAYLFAERSQQQNADNCCSKPPQQI